MSPTPPASTRDDVVREELIKRVEAAGSPSRLLDADIQLLLGQEPNEHYKHPWRRPILLAEEHRWPGVLEYVEISGVSARAAPHFTSSLDAALSLCERALPGTEWEISTLYGVTAATVGLNDAVNGQTRATAATPALALCLATLRALSAAIRAGGAP